MTMSVNILYAVTSINFDLSDEDVTHVAVRLEAEDPTHTQLDGMRYAGFEAGMSAVEIMQGVENGDYPPYHEWSKQPYND